MISDPDPNVQSDSDPSRHKKEIRTKILARPKKVSDTGRWKQCRGGGGRGAGGVGFGWNGDESEVPITSLLLHTVSVFNDRNNSTYGLSSAWNLQEVGRRPTI
jgi:hypothetical protein